jgi:glutaryl-CoA dehydrogenase
MRDEVRPLVAEHWAEGTFPRQLVARFRESGLVGLPYEGYGEPGPAVSHLVTGTMAMEMCRDGSRPGQRGGCGHV